MEKKMKPDEFVKALKDKSLRNPISLEGLAKEGEDQQSILFSQDGCASWKRIPLDSIEEVEFIREVACKDHSHPLIRLTLKRPTGQGEVFADLLDGLLSRLNAVRSERPTPQPARPPQRRRDPREHGRPYAARSDGYCTGCKAYCVNDSYYSFGQGYSDEDCNTSWEACFSSLAAQCSDRGGVRYSTQQGTYCDFC